jgi:hypothetical protein
VQAWRSSLLEPDEVHRRVGLDRSLTHREHNRPQRYFERTVEHERDLVLPFFDANPRQSSTGALLPGVRRTMFSEPLLAHPAKIGGVPAAWHPHRRDNDDRNPRDDEAENEQHMVARPKSSVGAQRSWHRCRHLSVRLCTTTGEQKTTRITSRVSDRGSWLRYSLNSFCAK